MIGTAAKSQFINITFDGNSIVAGQGVSTAARYSDLIMLDTDLVKTFGSVKQNIAVGGQTTVDMITRQSSYLFPYYESRCARNLVIAMEVRNDLYFGASDATALADIQNYIQYCNDHNFDVIWINQTPSTGGTPVGRTQAQLETSRQWVRSQMLGIYNVSTPIPLLTTDATGRNFNLDLAGDSIMGDVSYCSNLTYYQDGTHWTSTLHTRAYNYQKPVLQYYKTLRK